MTKACEQLAHQACAGCDCICHLDAGAGVDIVLEELT